jgi:hypothetical protein
MKIVHGPVPQALYTLYIFEGMGKKTLSAVYVTNALHSAVYRMCGWQYDRYSAGAHIS